MEILTHFMIILINIKKRKYVIEVHVVVLRNALNYMQNVFQNVIENTILLFVLNYKNLQKDLMNI
ncbi:hypothetical protein PVNG_05044 [Plasmodium vivax North Korean]|uniref:Uncharacterized protein n=1 Tax=Plasmodium vivax North Korean TaxID=1035514 RepID=A0A0J9U5L0_PLAVI|nr:hypothetical protein PVNG_05044 [Plasmodium vivax North Korean]